jgi:hypothetical protein
MFAYLNNKYENFASKSKSKPKFTTIVNKAVNKAVTTVKKAATISSKPKVTTKPTVSSKLLLPGPTQIAISPSTNQYDEAVNRVNVVANDTITKIDKTKNQVQTQLNNTAKQVPIMAKNAVGTALKNAEPIAKELVRDVTGAFNYGKTYYDKNTDKMFNKGFKSLDSEMKKIPGNKKSSSFIFLIFVVMVVAIIFGIYFFKYNDSYVAELIKTMNGTGEKPSSLSGILFNLGILAIICGSIVISFVIFKAVVLKTDVNKSHTLKILSAVVTIGLPILAITIATIGNMPLMMRSFENTFGYWWTKGDAMTELTQKLFGGENNYNDYSIISTQLFEENFKYYLECMKKGSEIDANINLNRFKNIFLADSYFVKNKDDKDVIKIGLPKEGETDDLYKLLKMIVRKRHISEATWISLASVLTMYASYLYI